MSANSKITIYNRNHSEDHDRIELEYHSDNTCSRCGVSSINFISSGFFLMDSDFLNVYLVGDCPSCGRATFFEYPKIPASKVSVYKSLRLASMTPIRFPAKCEKTEFDKEISDLSPKFVEIYNQSELSESNNCNEICGMGYRKALEFLVKDFLCREHPDKSDEIRKEFLSTAINRIENNKLKILAQKSAWLGNDETHYIRKHEQYSASDLKSFIKAMLTYIESELCFEEANQISSAHN